MIDLEVNKIKLIIIKSRITEFLIMLFDKIILTNN